MKRKWSIFRDYYLKTTCFILVAVAVLFYFCYDRINGRENVLQVIMMDVRCPMEAQEEFEKESGDVINIDTQKEFVELSFCHSQEMLVTLMVNTKVDIFLMNEMYFEIMSSQQCLAPLDEMLEKEILHTNPKENLVIYKGEDGKIYGFSVRDHQWMKQFGLESDDDIILGIVESGDNRQNADEFAVFLLAE